MNTVDQRELRRVLRNWRAERDSAALYDALAQIERNPRRSGVFSKLAASEREHSAYWEERLRSHGELAPEFRPSLRTRMLVQLARRFGVAFVVPSITSRELADRDEYSNQQDASGAGLMKEERAHAAVMRRIGTYGGMPGEEEGAPRNDDTGSLGNNLRAAILGANDGLISVFSLLMGVAGGGAQPSTILLAGVAGLVAGACSMALGEWLSVTNAREMARSQIDGGVAELHAAAAWEPRELALIYEAKGMTEDEARRAAERIIAHDPHAIATLIREEHEFHVASMGTNPASAAAYSFALFALGALIPLSPFFFASGARGIIASIAVSLAALYVLGMLTSFFNGRSQVFSGLRQVVIGAAAAAVTYGAGRILGAVVL